MPAPTDRSGAPARAAAIPLRNRARAHSAVSAAAASTLALFFGTDAIGFCSTPDKAPAGFLTPGARCYGGFWEAAAEAGQSRIYGGIHYQFDNTAGLDMGRGIAQFIVGSAFGAVPEPASWAMLIVGFGAIGVAARSHRRAASRTACA